MTAIIYISIFDPLFQLKFIGKEQILHKINPTCVFECMNITITD